MAAAAGSRPTSGELEAAARSRFFFGHKSVGANILGGIPTVYAAAGMAAPTIVETREPQQAGSFIAHAQVGRNRDPHGKLKDFAELVDGPLGENLEVALVKFCYADVVADTDVGALFDQYRSTLDGLAERHRGLTLLYATVPLTTDRSWKANVKALLGSDDRRGPADNLARHRYNTLVRERYGDTGRLFDVAAVEATLDRQPMTRTVAGQPYHVLNRELSSDAGHLNAAGSAAAAAELLRVIAGNAR